MAKDLRKTAVVGAAVALAAATAMMSVLLLAALNGGGAARLGPVVLLELAPGYDRAANAELAKPHPDRAAEEAATRRALALSPYDNPAWVRLAELQVQRRGRLGPEGLKALETSYTLQPYDAQVVSWRIGLCLEQWDALTPQIRRSVLADATQFGRGPGRVYILAVMHHVRNPAGRFAAGVWLLLN